MEPEPKDKVIFYHRWCKKCGICAAVCPKNALAYDEDGHPYLKDPASRRNLDLTAIVVNNRTYGMTGGQQSPTTPIGDIATVAPYGNIDQPLDICKIAEVAGAAFVARTTAYHAVEVERPVARGIAKKGFAVIEVLSRCPVFYGRMNEMQNPVEMLLWYRDNTSPEYGEEYRRLVVRAQGKSWKGKATYGRQLSRAIAMTFDSPERAGCVS